MARAKRFETEAVKTAKQWWRAEVRGWGQLGCDERRIHRMMPKRRVSLRDCHRRTASHRGHIRMPTHFSGRSAFTRRLMPAMLMGLVTALLSGILTTASAHGAVTTAAAVPVAKTGTTGDAVTATTRNESGYRVRCFKTTVEVGPQYDASDSGTWNGHWRAAVEIAAGAELYSFDIYDGTAASKSFNFRVCNDYGRGLRGTYDVDVYWEQYDADGANIADGVTQGSLKYTLKPRAASRLTVTKAPYGSTGWRFAGRLARAGKPYAHQRVQLWIRLNGSWRDFEETKRTTAVAGCPGTRAASSARTNTCSVCTTPVTPAPSWPGRPGSG